VAGGSPLQQRERPLQGEQDQHDAGEQDGVLEGLPGEAQEAPVAREEEPSERGADQDDDDNATIRRTSSMV
jgi:hypothetical protein